VRGPAVRGPAVRGPAVRGPAVRGPAVGVALVDVPAVAGFVPGGPAEGVAITQNTITGSGGVQSGIHIEVGSYHGPMTVNFNRIVSIASGSGLVNDTADAIVDARWNWWGCNALPDGTGCDWPGGGAFAQITFSPWLILAIRSDPADIPAGQAATIVTSLAGDSGGGKAPGAFFAPVLTGFTADPGAVTAGLVTTDALLRAQTGWPAGQPRPERICGTVDNQTVCLAFAPAPPAGGTPGGPGDGAAGGPAGGARRTAGAAVLPTTGGPAGRLVIVAVLMIEVGTAVILVVRPGHRRPEPRS
jgi:hypothetical protein